MREITLEELLEAGCHFGHQVIRSNPKARDFVFEAREGIQIIDLAKTKEGLDAASEFVKEFGKKGSSLLVVSTKKQAKQTVEDAVKKTKKEIEASKKIDSQDLFYVTDRWIGGTLTNFSEVSKNLKKLEDLKKLLKSDEESAKYTKKELGQFDKERQRLEALYGGISGMKEEPQALFIVDSHLEELAVKEARNRGIETVAIVDTNADPLLIDWPIPANDDAVGSVSLIVEHILDAFLEGVKAQKIEKPSSAEASEGKEKKKTQDLSSKAAKEEPKKAENLKLKTKSSTPKIATTAKSSKITKTKKEKK